MPVSITSTIAWHAPELSRPEPRFSQLPRRIPRWQQEKNHPENESTVRLRANASSRPCAAKRKGLFVPVREARAAKSRAVSRQLLSGCRKRERKAPRFRENLPEEKRRAANNRRRSDFYGAAEPNTTIGPVGEGMPPAGSSVIATACSAFRSRAYFACMNA